MTTIELLEARLDALLGELGHEAPPTPQGARCVQIDDQLLLLTVFEQSGQGWVRIATVGLTEVEPSVALLHRLLQLDHDLLFGAFLLFEDRMVVYSHTLLARSLDADGLATALRYAAHVTAQEMPGLQQIARGCR